jgi:hypothetical protein
LSRASPSGASFVHTLVAFDGALHFYDVAPVSTAGVEAAE